LLTYINFCSVKLYVYMQNIFTVSKIIVCVIIIVVGAYCLISNSSTGSSETLISTGFEGTNTEVRSIVLAFYSCLWSYDGCIENVTNEVTKLESAWELRSMRNILLSIVIGVPLVTVIYCFTNVAYMSVLTRSEMNTNATAVAVIFGDKMLGVMSFIMPLGVALSTFGCALSIQFSVTRLCFVAGREGHMMEAFSYIHMRRLTPAPSVILQGLIALVFILAGDIVELIDFASFLIWTFYGTAMVALLVLRKVKKDTHRPFKVQIWTPIFMIFVSLFLILVPIIIHPTSKYFIALALIGVGFLVYVPFVYFKRQPETLIKKFTHVTQKLLEVVPPENQPD
ncbi:hypothetical protein L9F63_005672, partial [Diploptera punctata]